MPYWRNKTAIITGGSSGLGRALAEALSAQSGRLVLVARGSERLQAVVESLTAQGGDVHGVVADITSQDDVDRLFEEAIDRFGKLDLLVNCAGRSDRASALDLVPEVVRELVELNLIAAVRCTQVATPHLAASGGHLVNIGSLASKLATPYHGGYPASKFALAAYTQQLRLMLEPKGVHVLHVCPGPIAQRAAQANEPAPAVTPSAVPPSAQRPGAGAKLRAIEPNWLANRILVACERRRAELVVPRRAKLLVAVSALSPRLGDWLLRRSISSE